ncbi:MAG: GntR family transcriptional regulator [Bauldia sp.]
MRLRPSSTRKKSAKEPRREIVVHDLSTEAYIELKQAIRNGMIPSGTRITETELSSQLNMSRTPIREAIHRLESEGLLTHQPRKGIAVTQPDHQMILELYIMLETLEGTAAGLAAQYASGVEIETLAEFVSEEPQYFDDQKALSRQNQKIHALIFLAARNRYLLHSYEHTAANFSLLPVLPPDVARATSQHEGHVQILAAIRNRDSVEAERQAREHIRQSRKRRLGNIMQTENLGRWFPR